MANIMDNTEHLQSPPPQPQQGGEISLSGPCYVTFALMAACIGVFALMSLATGGQALGDPSSETLMRWGANFGPAVSHGQWWRLVTCSFVHIGVLHLVLNMMGLYYIGKPLEILQGSARMAFCYLFSVVAASLASIFWHGGTPIVSAGASGGIFGLMGAIAGMLIRHHHALPVPFRVGLRGWILNFLLYNCVWFFLPQVDNAAHVGGFVGGLVVSAVLARSPVREARARRGLSLPAAAALALVVALLAVFGRVAIAKTSLKPPLERTSLAEARRLATTAPGHALLDDGMWDDSPYAFTGRVDRVVRLAEYEGQAIVEGHSPLLVVMLSDVKAVGGEAPQIAPDRKCAYAIRSLTGTFHLPLKQIVGHRFRFVALCYGDGDRSKDVLLLLAQPEQSPATTAPDVESPASNPAGDGPQGILPQ